MGGGTTCKSLLMAVTAACLADLDPEAIAAGVAEFPGVPHRLEHICPWQGVNFINSWTLKPLTTMRLKWVCAPLKPPVVLIAGGEAKAGDNTRPAWLQTKFRKKPLRFC